MATEKKVEKKIGANLQAVKGMRDIMGEDYYKFQGFFEKAQEVSEYYGFKPIETPVLEYDDVFTTSIGEGTDVIDKEMYSFKTRGGDQVAMRPEHTAGTMRAYIENGMANQPQPVLWYHYGPAFRHEAPQKGRYRQFNQFDIDAFGSEKAIVDALVIKTVCTILEEAGAKDLSVDINSIGDKECRGRYVRELTNYYKKHLKDLPAVDKERLANNPLRILDSKDPKTIEINIDAHDHRIVQGFALAEDHHVFHAELFRMPELASQLVFGNRLDHRKFRLAEDFHDVERFQFCLESELDEIRLRFFHDARLQVRVPRHRYDAVNTDRNADSGNVLFRAEHLAQVVVTASACNGKRF